MKFILILFITALFLPNIESNTYNLQLKDILSTEVCSTGWFIFDAELNMPIKDPMSVQYLFQVALRASEGAGVSSCFIMYFEGKTDAKVGCITTDFHLRLYQVVPSRIKASYNLNGHTINVLPYSIKTPFQITTGSELYFYSTVYEIKLNFAKADETKNLEFYLVKQTSSANYAFTLDDINIECTVKEGKKLVCPVTAKNLIQESNHMYQAYIKDSNKNKKKNYFVNPIEVTLQYIK